MAIRWSTSIKRHSPPRGRYVHAALGGPDVTMYEMLDGLEIRSADQHGYLLRNYRTWLNRST
jgi:hypothetical protein